MPLFLCRVIAILTVTFVLSSSGYAATETPKTVKPVTSIGLTALAGGYRFASTQNLNAAPTYGLRLSYDYIGKSLIDSIGWELTANQFSTTSKSSGEKADGLLIRGDAIYSILPRSKWVPLIALGVGGQFVDRNGVSEKNPFLNYGIGLKYFFEDYLAVRADLRQLMVYNDVKTKKDLEFTTGLTYYFGKERKKKAPPKVQKPLPPPIPTLDETAAKPEPGLEPTEPVVSPYEMLGATGISVLGIDMAPPQYQPAAPPLARKSPALSYRSAEPPQKPATAVEAPAAKPAPVVEPAPVPVPKAAPAPAPVPKTAPAPAPAPVPAPAVIQAPAAPPAVQQQPQQKRVRSVRQITIEFQFSSDEVRPAYNKKLAEAAELIKSALESSAVIEGHTDNVGSLAGNLRLSERRAQSVKSELVKYGVDPRKITIKGHAFTKPKATNVTEVGRQRNRRAVAIITLIN